VYTPNGLAVGQAAVVLERWLGRRTDRLIATSTSEAVQAVKLGLVPAERLAVIANGIDLAPSQVATVDLRTRFGLPPGTRLIGCVARLVPQKAPEQYVRACAVVAASRPDVQFVLIGMGPQQALVDREVAAGGLTGRFHQVPHLPHAWAALDQLDVFVLPSAFEGGPYTPLEAMRAGVPVVLSDVVGNRDVVENGKSGLMAPFGASDATGAAILRLLDDAGLRSQLTTAATERLRTQFDVRLMGQALSRLYLELAAVPAPLTRRRTRRLPQPAVSSSSNSPVARASQYSS
jgi:glycosyltransferase involved in cell wall biosynthesis